MSRTRFVSPIDKFATLPIRLDHRSSPKDLSSQRTRLARQTALLLNCEDASDQQWIERITAAFYLQDSELCSMLIDSRYKLKVIIRFSSDISTLNLACIWYHDSANRPVFIFRPDFAGYALNALVGRWLATIPLFKSSARESPFRSQVLFNFEDKGGITGLSYCNNHEEALLVPDNYYLGTEGYAVAKSNFARRAISWESRSSTVFWRGSSTGLRTGPIEQLPRARLCHATKMYPNHREYDCKITSVVQATEQEQLELASLGILSEHVPAEDFDQYRYHIDIDGNTNSWPGFMLKLLSGGLVFKVRSPGDYKQWYYERLVEGEHFVEIQSDLSDLDEKIQHYKANDHLARCIASQGQNFAMQMDVKHEISLAAARITNYAELNRDLRYSIRSDGLFEELYLDVEQDFVDSDHSIALSQSLSILYSKNKTEDHHDYRLSNNTGWAYYYYINSIMRHVPQAVVLEYGTASAAACIIGTSCLYHSATTDVEFERLAAQLPSYEARLKHLFSKHQRFNALIITGISDPIDIRSALEESRLLMEPNFIFVCTNWNWDYLRVPVLQYFDQNSLQCEFSVSARTSIDGTHPLVNGRLSRLHNGLFVAAVARGTN